MDTRTFSVNLSTMIAILAVVLTTTTTSTMTKQAFAFEDPKHYNTTDEVLL